MEQTIAGIKIERFQASDGLSSGVEMVVADTGRLKLMLLPTRGMGIHSVSTEKLELGWQSPVSGPVNPAFIRLEEEGGTGWLRGFDEWLVRCGLFSHGAPAMDEIDTPLGGKREILLPLHGRIANTPAQSITVGETGDGRLCISADVCEAVVFGSRLRLRSSLYLKKGSRAFEIEDEVINDGGRPSEFELLYHLNFGPPILEEGARLLAPFKWVHPRDNVAAKGLERVNIYGPPTAGALEQAFFAALNAREDGSTDVVLHNAAGNLGCRVSFNVNEMPCFTLWKYEAGMEEGYVTGLEPSIGYPNPKPFERAKGRVPVLQAGESRRIRLRFAVLESASDVKDACSLVEDLPGTTEPVPMGMFD